MEIKSIKKIKQIGVFSNFEDASKRFEKLTFIYGFNTHGKSTLCDILNSLLLNDPTVITSRKTIPITNNSQLVELSYKQNETEKSIHFRNGVWDSNELSNYLNVFGTQFIHNNVFTGLTVARQNKENFTNFILGERGVSLAKELEETNRKINVDTRAIKKAIPPFVTGETPHKVEAFINLNVTESMAELTSKIETKTSELVSHKEKLANFDSILNLKVPQLLPKSDLIRLLAIIRYTNIVLNCDFDKMSKIVLDNFRAHISKNFKDALKAESWINEGLKISDISENSNCPFCGQNISNAAELLECYQQYFNQEYKEYIYKVQEALKKAQSKLSEFNVDLSSKLLDSQLKAKSYEPLIKTETFKQNMEELEKIKTLINECEINIIDSKTELSKDFVKKIDSKLDIPYEKSTST